MTSGITDPLGPENVRYCLKELNLKKQPDFDILKGFHAAIPIEEGVNVIPPEVRVDFHSADGSHCLILTAHPKKTSSEEPAAEEPAACLTTWSLLAHELNYLEFGTAVVNTKYRKRRLSSALVTLSLLRTVLQGSDLHNESQPQQEWERCFAVVRCEGTGENRKKLGAMHTILSDLGFRSQETREDLQQLRHARADLPSYNPEKKQWLFPQKCMLKKMCTILDDARDRGAARYPESGNLLIFKDGKDRDVEIDCSHWGFFEALPAKRFRDMILNCT